jgi:serine/threonine-protein kinase HipA
MNTINVYIDFGSKTHRVGELFSSADLGRHVFSYDPDFISSGLQISPFHLPLEEKTYIAHRNSCFYDLHGVFSDSLPDAWGRKVQDAEFLKIGIIEPTALQRLAFIGQNGIGSLRYHPAQEFPKGEDVVRLAELRKATQRILEGNIEDISEQLLKSGGSAGGARPKFLVDINESNHQEIRYTRNCCSDGYIPVILKVPNSEKEQDQYQRIEYVYSQIARNAGLNIPDTYLISGEKSELAFFAIKRFDIQPDGSRVHVHTLSGVLNIDYRETNPDSSKFLRTIEDITRDQRQVIEGYRRIVFNYVGSNKDDHAKNFSFLMNQKGEWSLSPAYDIGFSKGQNDLHQMRLGSISRNAETKDFRSLAKDFDIPKWDTIIEKTLAAFEKWPAIAKDNGVPEKYIDTINQKLKENTRRIESGLNRGLEL